MAYQVVPNTRGVQQWVGPGTDPNIEDVFTLPGGDTMVNTKTSPWVKTLPWLVGGAMAAPALASLLAPAFAGATGAAGAATGTTAAAGGVPSGLGFGGLTAAQAYGAAAPIAAKTAAATAGFWSPTTVGLLNAGIGAGTQLIGAGMQSKAANKAAQLQQAANAETLAFLRDQDTKDRAQYGEERSRLWGQQDVDRARAEENRQLLMLREREREGRLAPFRSRDSGAYRRLSDLVMG